MGRRAYVKYFARCCSFIWGILIFAVCVSMIVGNIEANATSTVINSATEDVDVQLGEVKADNLNQKGYDVVYVIDNSRSVWSQQSYRNQAFKNISNLAVGADIRVGVVFFADHIYKYLGLTSMETEEGSKKVLDFLNMTEQDDTNVDTNIGTALEAAIKLFDSQAPGRERIVVLFSDGVNENSKGDPDYKKSADNKTKQQVGILKDMDALIYCVYLQKDYNYEEYLKELVNYFSSDVDYAGERFSKITENEISSLSVTFADVFYGMQNNMKYGPVELDASGTDSFHVPSLGITKVRIYLDGSFTKAAVVSKGEAARDKWTDGSAAFFVYDDPVSGEWSLNVTSSDYDSVYGTIAYYTNPQASARIVEAEDENESFPKHYRLVVTFKDEEGKDMEIDTDAEVTASVMCTGDKKSDEDTSKDEPKLSMRISDEGVTSEKFTMEEYGDYSFKVNLAYDEYVDLDYTFSGITVEKSAPVTTNIDSGSFKGEKSADGIQFSIPESDLFTDPEEETVKVMKIIQLNAANKVDVTQKDGYVVVTAESASDVEFELQLEDTSGMEASVTIKGTVIDRGDIRVIRNTVIVLIIIIIAGIAFFIVNGKRKKGELNGFFDEFDQTSAEFSAIYAICEEEMDRVEVNRKNLNLYLHGAEGDLEGIVEMAAELTEEQQDMFGVTEYIAEGYEKKAFEQLDMAIKNIAEAKDTMRQLGESTEAIRSNQKNTGSAIKSMSDICTLAASALENLKSLLSSLRDGNDSVEISLNNVLETGGAIDEMLTTDIQCDLTVMNISALHNARGTMAARNYAGRTAQGYYRLDDILLLGGKGALGSERNLGDINIYVYGYSNEELGEVGLQLKSAKPFALKDCEGNIVKGTEVKILRGNVYELMVNTRFGQTSMRLSVK